MVRWAKEERATAVQVERSSYGVGAARARHRLGRADLAVSSWRAVLAGRLVVISLELASLAMLARNLPSLLRVFSCVAQLAFGSSRLVELSNRAIGARLMTSGRVFAVQARGACT